MFGYIYLVTNNIDNKKYIGKRESSEFDKYYWGSGKYLQNAIHKYGKENFSREILAWAETKEELCRLEEEYILKYDAIDSPEYYNLTKGGIGGGSIGEDNGAYGKHWYTNGEEQILCFEQDCPEGWHPGYSESRKKQIQQINLGRKFSDEHRKQLSEAHKASPVRSMLGKHQSEYFKQRMSEIHKGKTIPPEMRKRISETLKDGYKQGRITKHLGRKVSEETRKKISEALTGSTRGPHTEETKRKISMKNSILHKGRIWINNGIESHQIRPEKLDEYLNKGYVKGSLVPEGYKPVNTGKICVNDGVKNKYVLEEDLQYYIEKGYVKGGLPRKRRKKYTTVLAGEGSEELAKEFEEDVL